MSDIKLFQVRNGQVESLSGTSVAVERSLQALIERHLEAMLGVRLLGTEYSTGKTHGGRIDTLGIDENGSPVIIEYKRATNENVINQGLYYLDWLLDHKGEFKLLVLEQFGKEQADNVDWSSPRLLCIAGDFTKFDGHAVSQINRNIELLRYRRYGEDLLLFELVNTPVIQEVESGGDGTGGGKGKPSGYRTVTQHLAQATRAQNDRFEALKAFLLALGDDVQFKTLKYYYAFQRLKNFACVEIRNQSENLVVYVKGDPEEINLEPGFTRDVRTVGHFGTGDIEIIIRGDDDLERAKPLLTRSYEAS
ncbi:MAG TPA: endonuclease NucS domain-containing protein [Chloroflexota bacterium]